MLSQILSALVYAGSAAILTAVVLLKVTGRRSPLRYALLLPGYAGIAVVASLELPITRLPFWSRDFSLTWTLMVAALGIATVVLLPRIIQEVWGSRGIWLLRLTDPQPRHDAKPAFQPPGDIGLSDGAPLAPAETLPDRRARLRLLIPVGIFVGAFLLVFYWRGAEINLLRVNTDSERVDQSAYLVYALNLLETEFSHVGDRNRMPIYPFLLTVVIDPALPFNAIFLTAKYFNLALSLGLLAVIGLLVRNRLRSLESTTVILVTAFTLFAFKAPYVQAELVFYTLTAVLFRLMIDFFRKPSNGLAVAIGLVAGLAHLTKASALLGLAVFLLAAAGSAVWSARTARSKIDPRVLHSELLGHALLLGLVIGFFLLTVFPYIKNSWYRFGRPFYNVNSTLYVWYDNWGQVLSGTRAHGDRLGWPDMPASEIPSLQKYLREHTLAEMAGRLWNGVGLTVNRAIGSYGYAAYVMLAGVALGAASVLESKRLMEGIRKRPGLALFLAGYFAVQFLSYAWFAAIVRGNRLVLSLLVPLLVSVSLALRYLLSHRTPRDNVRRVGLLESIYILLLFALGVDILLGFLARIGTTFGGS